MGYDGDLEALEDALFEALPLAALIHGPMTIIDINAAGREILEATDPSDVIGLQIRDVVHPEAREAGVARRELLLKHGQRFTGVPIKLVSAKGNEVRTSGGAVPFMVGANPLATALAMPAHATSILDGNAVSAMPHFSKDTPVRSAALRSLPLPIVAMRGATVVYVNPAACVLMSATSSEVLVGHSMLEFVHADMVETLAERLALGITSASTGGDVRGKFTTLDGDTRYIRTCECLIEEGPDALIAWVITGVDQ